MDLKGFFFVNLYIYLLGSYYNIFFIYSKSYGDPFSAY